MSDIAKIAKESRSTSAKARDDLYEIVSASTIPEEQDRRISSFMFAAEILSGVIRSGKREILESYLGRDGCSSRPYPNILTDIAQKYFDGEITHQRATQSAEVAVIEYKRIVDQLGHYKERNILSHYFW